MTLCEMLATAIQEACGHSEEKAKSMAAEIVEWGGKNGHSGCEYYWPAKARFISPEERDAQIRQEFSGGNLKEICHRFGCSRDTVYRAVRCPRN